MSKKFITWKDGRYLYVETETQDSERRYIQKTVHVVHPDSDLEKFAIQTFTSDEMEADNEWFWDSFGETATRLHTYNEITLDEYNVLNKYI